jgi:hypothetical protein
MAKHETFSFMLLMMFVCGVKVVQMNLVAFYYVAMEWLRQTSVYRKLNAFYVGNVSTKQHV